MTIQQFFDKYNGKFVEYHSYGAGALYQCADLANQFIKEVLNLTPIIGTNAKDFPERANKNEFEYIKNTDDFIPQLGDIMVWDLGNAWGHIAIIKSANINNFVSFDQNWPTGSPCKFVTHNYNGVRGVLRAKTMTIIDDALNACLSDREKFWKERDNYKSKYEAEVDKNTKLQNNFDQYKSEVEAKVADLQRDKESAQNEAKEYKVANQELLRDLANILGTTQQKAQIVTEVNALIAIEDEGKKAIDDLRMEKLQRKTVETELNNEIAKLKTQLATKDLTEHDFETLLKALIQKIVKVIKEK